MEDNVFIKREEKHSKVSKGKRWEGRGEMLIL